MLGWDIYVYRQADGGASPATERSSHGTMLAEWSADVFGHRWIEDMVKSGEALTYGDNSGYPCGYTVKVKDLAAHLVERPPEVKGHQKLHVDEGPARGAFPADGLEERDFIDQATLAGCRPDEWLGVEAWDLS